MLQTQYYYAADRLAAGIFSVGRPPVVGTPLVDFKVYREQV